MPEIGNWLLPLLVVVVLAVATLVFARFIGQWIDAQGNSVVDKPRETRKRRSQDTEHRSE